MQTRMIRISSVSILAGVFVAILQTCLLYFLEDTWITLLVIALADLIISQYLLESSFSYHYCFRFLFVAELFTLAIGVPAYLGLYGTLLPFSVYMLWLAVLHFAVPSVFCMLRYLMDFGPRFMNYNLFFLESSLLLWAAIIAGFFYCYVYQQPVLTHSDHVNLVPFYSLASLIEAYIETKADIRPTVYYLLQYAAFFIPVGFYLHLLIGKRLFLRLFSFLFVPALIELEQYFLLPSMCDIDDLVPAFLGCIVGSLLFTMLNTICQSLHENDFLQKQNRKSLYL
ncbi:MAG: hypothetical protein HFH36_14390 [Lachnospiraceae bacterium]|jgi:hypothetical protein|nr:hypothetical protein [Lachnospiraceae bacterium]MCI9448520.1 hypothetical protein [Lachnospiraceae bacterium]